MLLCHEQNVEHNNSEQVTVQMYHNSTQTLAFITVVDIFPLPLSFLFQTQDNSNSVNWDFHDDESGIDFFELAIFEMRHGSKTKIYPAGKYML